MRVVVTDAAWNDLFSIGSTIRKDSPSRAEQFVEELYDRCHELAAMPLAFPIVPELADLGTRRRVHGKYLIFYHIADDVVVILHILHGAMDYEALLRNWN
jgi:toxin ParE1/3/4